MLPICHALNINLSNEFNVIITHKKIGYRERIGGAFGSKLTSNSRTMKKDAS